MKFKLNLLFIFVLWLLTSLFISSAILSYFWIWDEYKIYENKIKSLGDDLLQNEKDKIKSKVEHIAENIEFEKNSYFALTSTKLIPNSADNITNNMQNDGVKKHILKMVFSIDEIGKDSFFIYSKNSEFIFAKSCDCSSANEKKKYEIGLKKIIDSFGQDKSSRFFELTNQDINGSFRSNLDSNQILDSKIVYASYIKDFDWIIGKGFLKKNIDEKIEKEKKELNIRIKINIIKIISFLIILLILLVIIFLYFYYKNKNSLKYLIELASQKEPESLEPKDYNIFFDEHKEIALFIQEAISSSKDRQNDELKMLLKKKEEELRGQSKFVLAGEMVSSIAHQWRQPLNEITSYVMNIELRSELGTLEHQYLKKKTHEINKIVKYMSDTIEDFRQFLGKKEEEGYFYLKDCYKTSMLIASSAIKENKIKILLINYKNVKIKGISNDLTQVLINIFLNSTHQFRLNNTKNPKITIEHKIENNTLILKIKDNGGGILIEPIENIFNPYVSSKGNIGKGLGLFIAKMIVTGKLNGKIYGYNEDEGAVLMVKIPLPN